MIFFLPSKSSPKAFSSYSSVAYCHYLSSQIILLFFLSFYIFNSPPTKASNKLSFLELSCMSVFTPLSNWDIWSEKPGFNLLFIFLPNREGSRESINIIFSELNLWNKEIRLEDFWGPFQLWIPRCYSQKEFYDIIYLNPVIMQGAPSDKRMCPSEIKSPESSPVLLTHTRAPF